MSYDVTLSVPDEGAYAAKKHTTAWLWEQDTPVTVFMMLHTSASIENILRELTVTYPGLTVISEQRKGPRRGQRPHPRHRRDHGAELPGDPQRNSAR